MFDTRRSQGRPQVIARRCRDGDLVVRHDARLPDGRPVVEVALLDLPGWLPTLDAALDACAGLGVNIEIKNEPNEPGFEHDRRLADDVVALVVAKGDRDRVLVSSFDRPTLDRVRAVDADVATAWLVTRVPADALAVLVDGGHQALHPWWEAVDRELIARCHSVGLGVNVWTCDDPEAMTRLAGWGVDGICTNVPDVAAALFGPRPR